jgi:hypothetical protein
MPASVIELDDDQSWDQAHRRWRDEVAPLIARDPDMPDRADRAWNWRRIRGLARVAGQRRQPRFFQIRCGEDERPAAMVLLLADERWPGNRRHPAVFLWYLSVATRGYLTYPDGTRPLDVGLAAIDTAVVVSLTGDAKGRLWLHADPNAGQPDLCRYYGLTANMGRIPSIAVPVLPSSFLKPRHNDERYFAFTEQFSGWAASRLDWLRT